MAPALTVINMSYLLLFPSQIFSIFGHLLALFRCPKAMHEYECILCIDFNPTETRSLFPPIRRFLYIYYKIRIDFDLVKP